MCIDIDTVIANAIISLYYKFKIDNISITKVNNYEKRVKKDYYDKHNKRIFVNSSKDIMNKIESGYHSYLQSYIDGDETYIRLKSNVSISDLTKRYRSYLPIDVLETFAKNI